MTVAERLKEYLHSTKKNATQLAKEIGVSQRGLQDVLNSKNQPSAKILMPLFIHGLSIDWLFSGEGEMLRTSPKKDADQFKNSPINDISVFMKLIEEKDDWYKKMVEDTNESYKQLLAEKEKRLQEKEKRIEDKERLLQEKDEYIQLLKSNRIQNT